eukprot:3969094-Karenia_brevis.AAC.1
MDHTYWALTTSRCLHLSFRIKVSKGHAPQQRNHCRSSISVLRESQQQIGRSGYIVHRGALLVVLACDTPLLQVTVDFEVSDTGYIVGTIGIG